MSDNGATVNSVLLPVHKTKWGKNVQLKRKMNKTRNETALSDCDLQNCYRLALIVCYDPRSPRKIHSTTEFII